MTSVRHRLDEHQSLLSYDFTIPTLFDQDCTISQLLRNISSLLASARLVSCLR